MSKKIKSMRGESVDFDLLKIKQQISEMPAPIEVSERKSIIDNKLQRRIQQAKEEIKKAKLDQPEVKEVKKVKKVKK